jgi:putative addiction module killer protein
MITVEKTAVFDRWLRKLKDPQAKARILFRLQKLQSDGHLGDCEPVGQGIAEMRIHWGPRYRIYLKQRGNQWFILLAGGTKATQQGDIVRAQQLWKIIQGTSP